MKRTAVEWFVDGLTKRGVEWISALCGHGLDPLFFAAARAGLRIIDVRNEQTAAYMADYYGRLTGRPGICASSSGVAVANAVTGVMNAWFDHAPLIYISGTANSTTLGLGAFQDSDHVGLARPVTKQSVSIDHPARAVQMLDVAWETAVGLPCGPVHLQFPMDVQNAEVAEDELVLAKASAPAPATASAQHLNEIAAALASASKPLIIAGTEVYYAREGAAMAAFAQEFSIPVQTPIWDRGMFDAPSEVFHGVIGAASGGPALLEQSDCVLLAADNDYRVGYLKSTGTVFRLTQGWAELASLLKSAGRQPFTAWNAEARRLRDEHTQLIASRAEAQRVPGRTHSIDVVRVLKAKLPSDASLVIDGGSIGQWAHQTLCTDRYPSYWLTCGRSGVVGYGLGGAMAAKLAMPQRPVVLLSGDGAFTFTVAEIECAVRQQIPFTAVVVDDQCWGITHSGHIKQFGKGVGTTLGAIDFARLAESMGARGQRIDSIDALAPALQQAMQSGEVTILHVPVSGGNPA